MRSPSDVAAMQCPVCRTPLAMSDRQGIEIDYWSQCRGVWLDRGELDKIIERSAPASAPPPPQQQSAPPPYPSGGQPGWSEPRHGHGKPHYKKPKHWLSDIFD